MGFVNESVPHLRRSSIIALLTVVALVVALCAAPADAADEDRLNSGIGYPTWAGDPNPVPALDAAVTIGGQLQAQFDADVAAGAGSSTQDDFWIDEMLARHGTAGGYGDSNNWLFSRGRAAYMYTHQPGVIGFGGSAAYWDELGVDAIFEVSVLVDGQAVTLQEAPAERKQTPSYWRSTFRGGGLELVQTKYITHQNVAVAGLELRATDGVARTVEVRASSPLVDTVEGDELTGVVVTKNDITTLYPRLSGDGMTPVDGALSGAVSVPADGAVTTKVQLGYVTEEIPESRTEYDAVRAADPAAAYTAHVTAYNRWWAENVPYLDTPEDNIDKTLFYRWWLMRFNFLDADVPGNDYQFPTSIEGVTGYNNAIVLTTGMFIDDLKYFRDPSYAYGTWVSAGETARSGRFVDNPGEPANWSNSYTQYISEAGWRSYQLHGGPVPIAENLAVYAENDVRGLLEDYDSNDNLIIEYDWGAMTGNDADAVSFDWAREFGNNNPRMDRTENAYLYSNALAAAEAYRLAGQTAEADEMEALAADIRASMMTTLWNADTNLIEHRQVGAGGELVDWMEINNYYPFTVGLVPQPGEDDYDDDYVEALRLWRYADEYPIFPFYTANQADAAERGGGGSNNFSIINSTVTFRMLSRVLREYPTEYIDADYYKKLLYWNAWAHYIDGDNRLPDQNEFWNSATANTEWGDTQDIGYRSWIHHTILGTTNFTMIEDAMGLRPRSDARLELDPIDIDWPHFMADNIRYRNADLTIVWDEPGDGERPYGDAVPEGYSAFLDGQLAFTADSLGRIVYDPASGTVVEADDHVTVTTVAAATVQAPSEVTFAGDERVVDLFAKAGADIDPATVGTPNVAEDAAVTASFTSADPWSTAAGAVDGTTINEPFWGTAGSPDDTDWLEVDLGQAQAIDEARVHFYRTSSSDNPQGGRTAGTRPGYAAPSMFTLEVMQGGEWVPVAGQSRTPTYPEANYNLVRFPEVTTDRIRLAVTHAPGFRTGVKELQLRSTGLDAPTVTNAPPDVRVREDAGYGQAGSARVIGTVRDDALPTGQLDATWTVVDAPDGATALFDDPGSATTLVRFSQGGSYTLRLTATDGEAEATADLVVQATGAGEGTTNVAPAAEPSASYTAGWNDVGAVNDGEGQNSGGPQTALWGTWSGNRPSSQWLQYTWSSPVRVSGSEIMFWTDSAAGTGDGVAVPESWVIEYLDAEGDWIEVPDADAYGTARQGTNVTSFGAVTTTALRATFQASPNAAGTAYSAIGVAEWEIFADRPVAVDELHVRTTVDELPELPTTIGVTYADGSRSTAPVAWPEIQPEQVESEGDFTLTGIVSGTPLPAEVTVWVRSDPPGQINGTDPAEVRTTVGVAPHLPEQVVVLYNDGSREMLDVTWDPIDPAAYAQPGEFQVEGQVQGTGVTTATALVTVVEADEPDDTTAPAVSIAVEGDDRGADRYAGPVQVTVTATDEQSGVDTIEVAVDGGDWAAYTDTLTIEAVGDHTVAARASDVAGNTSAETTDTFTILGEDTTPPEVSLEVTDGDVYAGGQLVTATATDDGAGVELVELSLDGGDWVAYSGPVTVNRIGSHEARARATDVLGNTSAEVTATFEVATDPDAPEPAGNPIVRDPYTSDPSALVSGDRLYLYTGHDEAPPGQQSWTMDDWQVFSTDEVIKDPSAWTHHGERLTLEDFEWAQADAWAGEVEERDGRFYWYVPVDGAGEGWHDIGVAVGDSPNGPFVDALGEPLISDSDLVDAGFDSGNNIDPSVFVDDDGQAYLYWGSFWAPRMVRLADDMVTTEGEITEPEGLEAFWEAPFLFERDGTYYVAYASNENLDDDGCVTASTFACIRYATADSPAGPWTHQGIILDQVSSTTNHPAVVEFDDQWWMIYHTADAEGGGNFRRSVAIDELEFADDGSIERVVQTPVVEDVPPITDNVGLYAQPSASYTAPFSALAALNDGEVPPDGEAFWTTWPDNDEHWVQYDWAHDVRVDAVDLWFMQDVADDASGGVKVPESYEILYRDGEEWVPVPNADGYGGARDAFNTTTFDPVTTDGLRVVMVNPQPDVDSGVGIYEWRVHHVQPTGVEDVAVTTAVDEPPVLPDTVELTYPGDVVLSLPVTWLGLADLDVSTPGDRVLDGVVPGSLTTATATVTVEDGSGGGGGPITPPPPPPVPPAGDPDDGGGLPDDLTEVDVLEVLREVMGIDTMEELDPTELSVILSRLLDRLVAGGDGTAFAQADGREVLLASNTVFADALASGALQTGGRRLLLTDPAELDEVVLDEIQALEVESVTILGGEVAVSAAVEDRLVAEGIDVDRIAGVTRIETAIAVAEAVGIDDDVLLARAFADEGDDATQAFADSLAAGGWASQDATPLLLSQREVLTDATAQALQDSPATDVTVLGGTAAIAEEVIAAIEAVGLAPDRVEGPTRFATAAAVAAARGFTPDDPAERVIVIEGQADNAWTAGFAAAALSGALDAPILLVTGDELTADTESFLTTSFAPTDGPAPVVCIASEAACAAVADVVGLGD